MYIYLKDEFPTNIMPDKLTYYQNNKRFTVLPPYSVEQLILAGYSIVDNPPELPDGYRLEWVNKSWHLHPLVAEDVITEKERPDDQDPITGEAMFILGNQ